MKKLSIIEKIEFLENFMNGAKFPKKFFVISDEIKGKTFALASKDDLESINIHSGFMTYEQFKCYLFGRYDMLTKKF